MLNCSPQSPTKINHLQRSLDSSLLNLTQLACVRSSDQQCSRSLLRASSAVRAPGSAYWRLLYPWKTLRKHIYFLLCTRTTQPHWIARSISYAPNLLTILVLNYIRRIQIEFQNQIFDDVMGMWNLIFFFAKFLAEPFKNHALPSSSQILETYS